MGAMAVVGGSESYRVILVKAIVMRLLVYSENYGSVLVAAPGKYFQFGAVSPHIILPLTQ